MINRLLDSCVGAIDKEANHKDHREHKEKTEEKTEKKEGKN